MKARLLLLLPFLLLLFPSQGQAASFEMEVTNARLNLGWAFSGTQVLPAPDNIGGNPLPDLWEARDTMPATCLAEFLPGPTPNPNYPCSLNPASATISGEIDSEGNVSVEPSDFRFPVMVVISPVNGAPVPITLAATSALSGEMNAGNGELSLGGGSLEARVLLLTAPASADYPVPPLQSYCSVPLPGLELSTAASVPASVGFAGTPFAGNDIESAGALTGTWRVAGPSIRNGNTVYGDPVEDKCAGADIATQGLGGLWLGAGIAEPAPYPTCETGGEWPNCLQPFSLQALSILPAQLRAGRSGTLRLRLRNGGEVASSVSVRLKMPRGIRGPKSVSVRVPASSATTHKIRVRVSRSLRGKRVVVRASSKGKRAQLSLRIR